MPEHLELFYRIQQLNCDDLVLCYKQRGVHINALVNPLCTTEVTTFMKNSISLLVHVRLSILDRLLQPSLCKERVYIKNCSILKCSLGKVTQRTRGKILESSLARRFRYQQCLEVHFPVFVNLKWMFDSTRHYWKQDYLCLVPLACETRQ